MKRDFWIITTIVVSLIGFMLGYSVPPFVEVGFGNRDEVGGSGPTVDKELMKQYENLLKQQSDSE